MIRGLSSLVLAGCLVAVLPSLVHAKIREVLDLTKPCFRWVQVMVRRNPTAEIGPKEIKVLKKAVLSDNQVDPSERALLEILESQDYDQIKVSARKSLTFSPSDQTLRKSVNKEGIAAIKAISTVTYSSPLEALYHSGEDGFKEMVRLYVGSPEKRRSIHDLLVKKVNAAWKKSSYKDDFSHLRGVISRDYGKLRGIDGSLYKQGKVMLYEAILAADDGGDGSTVGGVPNHLYEWMKPRNEDDSSK